MKTEQRGYSAIGLWNPKDYLNVGSALRACGVYGASMMACGGPRNDYRQAPTDTIKAHRHIPFLQVPDLKNIIPYKCVPVAVDVIEGATPLPRYNHPERAFYIFGPENGTLETPITDWCKDIVQVPTNYCMNLAASVNVVLYDRLMKNYINNAD